MTPVAFADMHSHFLLNAAFLGRRFDRPARGPLPWGPFGNRVDRPGAVAGGASCITFTAYAPPIPFLSPWESLLRQVRAFERLVAESGGALRAVRTGSEAGAAAADGAIAGVLAVEGGRALAGDPARVEPLALAGVRMLTLVHFVANALGDAAQSPYRPHGGLSVAGLRVLEALERHGVLPDVAHLSDEGVRQLLRHVRGPVVCSHTGMRALADLDRNLSDDLARRIAATGGVIGIILYPPYLRKGAVRAPLDAFLDHVVHAASVAGPDHVGIGSDLDGYTWTPDGFGGPADFPAIADGLRRRGFSDAEVRGIAGGNYLRVLG